MSHEYFDGAESTDFDLEVGDIHGLRAWQYQRIYECPLVPRHVLVTQPWRPGVNVAVCGADPGSLGTIKDPTGRGRTAVFGSTWSRFGRTVYEITWNDGSMDSIPADRLQFEPVGSHTPPLLHCGCGFYAYHSPDNWLGNTTPATVQWKTTALILGAIRGYGHTLIGTRGFRCARAEIIGLVRPSAGKRYSLDVDEHLRRAYPDVPLYNSPEELVAAVPLEREPSDHS